MKREEKVQRVIKRYHVCVYVCAASSSRCQAWVNFVPPKEAASIIISNLHTHIEDRGTCSHLSYYRAMAGREKML